MGKYTITYNLKKVTDGYVARCTTNPMATAFGQTPVEAKDNLVKAITGYVNEWPDRLDDILGAPSTEVDITK